MLRMASVSQIYSMLRAGARARAGFGRVRVRQIANFPIIQLVGWGDSEGEKKKRFNDNLFLVLYPPVRSFWWGSHRKRCILWTDRGPK